VSYEPQKRAKPILSITPLLSSGASVATPRADIQAFIKFPLVDGYVADVAPDVSKAIALLHAHRAPRKKSRVGGMHGFVR